METIKQQADSYVEIYHQFGLDEIDCTRIAIIHVEGLIEELEIYKDTFYPEINIDDQTEILTELKSRI